MIKEINIRTFEKEDAVFCFKTRVNAFVKEFYHEIGPAAVAAGINAYLPMHYRKMSRKYRIFILENNERPLGFFMIKRLNRNQVEIPLIYFSLDHLKAGLGKQSILFAEDWIRVNWKNVKEIIIDTIIPKYNGGFYKKLGYIEQGEAVCTFPDMDMPAIRFSKNLKAV